jgi:fatty-acid peroxygenase
MAASTGEDLDPDLRHRRILRLPHPASRSRRRRSPLIDRSAGWLLRGYRYLPALRRPALDGVATVRLAGRRATVAAGPEAVRAFYDTERFARGGAVPGPLMRTLFGRGAVHGLDGEAHRVRKAMFLETLAADRVDALADRVDHEWAEAVRRWQGLDRIVLFDEAVRVLGRGVLAWAGVPTPPHELDARADDLATIVDGFGSAGVRHLRARLARRRCEAWARRAVRQVRSGRLRVAAETALGRVATHRDLDGSLLDERTAAVELLNLLRPTVAVAWLVTFAGMALLERPDWRDRLVVGTDDECRAFVDEVRRRYPFVPALAAVARDEVDWAGHQLPAGSLFVLDVWGTNTDPATWTCPFDLDPDRFVGAAGVAAPRDALVPQGGGDARTGHRCPGEAATVELTVRAARLLAGLSYRVLPQDLRISRRRMPTRPRSGLVLGHVRSV